jgi:micrococcal nuclease
MQRLFIALAMVLALAFPALAEEAHVLEVLDGDSLLVEVRGLRAQVRLLGIDTPEYSQEWGQQARDFSLAFCTRGPGDLE